ncbi:hypothetical protein [Desulfosporosinus fructosivorans]
MKKTNKSPDKKNTNRSIWDYIAAGAFIVAGTYFLATQRLSQGAIYILVGLFFIFITRSRQK